eukprot:EG_transcript_16109
MACPVHVVDLAAPEPVAATALLEAATQTGFLYLENHGVAPDVADRFLGAVRRLFALPPAAKERLTCSPGFGYNGQSITLDPSTQSCPDLREQWKVSRTGYDEDYARGEDPSLPSPSLNDSDLTHPPQDGPFWPPEEAVPGLRRAVAEYFAAVDALSRRVLRLLALAIGLPGGYFAGPGLFDRPATLLNCNHYLPEPSHPEDGRFGCGAHTDYGMLTILLTDEVPGLQICPDAHLPESQRHWVDVPPRPGSFIVNLGDMLQQWTNDRLRSTLHRVVNATGRERFSSAFFLEPNFDCRVECLDCCCDADHPPKYPPVTYGDWLRQRFTETGEVVA